MKRFVMAIFAAVTLLPRVTLAEPPIEAHHHVVLVVWDGMRPDFVSETGTPRLWAMAKDGVRFAHHHSVYPTSTEVNGAVLATGVYPNRNSLLANHEYRPQIDAHRIIDTGEPDSFHRGDAISAGHYLAVPTIAESARAAGLRTAVAGSKSVAYFHDRKAEWASAITPKTDFTIFAAAPMPSPIRDETQRLFGRFLNAPDDPSSARNAYVTKTLTDVLWRSQVADYSVLWLSEPDRAQHDTAPGADVALAGIRNSDTCLGMVLDALTARKMREDTDVLVVSDHGFSTVKRTIDLPAELNAAGFTAMTERSGDPKPGEIMVATNSGTVLFYVAEHDAAVAARLIMWLQHSDIAGVLFAREKYEGTFPLERAHLETAFAPDVVMSCRWDGEKSSNGTAGRIVAAAIGIDGKGSHHTLSPFDVHNIFFAAGPDFRAGATDDLPTGNIDLAATIFGILGLSSADPLDGRVVTEAMTHRDSIAIEKVESDVVAASRIFPDGEWRQTLHLSRVGKSVYIDDGDGAFSRK
ncbi:MAG: alkaline phosphatase family protein [Verrucomicrobiota bacterium]|nr:alkaline phosphatase family protein [Verrucomicrobiota bacterium]